MAENSPNLSNRDSPSWPEATPSHERDRTTRTVRVQSVGIHGRRIILVLDPGDIIPVGVTHTRVTLLRRRWGFVVEVEPGELQGRSEEACQA